MRTVKPRVIWATPYIKERGAYDTRLVVLEWYNPDGSVREYSRHFQTRPNMACFWGHYFFSEKAALLDLERTIENDRSIWGNKSPKRLAHPEPVGTAG
jgi:hypothetical protein